VEYEIADNRVDLDEEGDNRLVRARAGLRSASSIYSEDCPDGDDRALHVPEREGLAGSISQVSRDDPSSEAQVPQKVAITRSPGAGGSW
jgi:hypothetical protein